MATPQRKHACELAIQAFYRTRHGPPNTGDKLRSSIACAGFVCFIPLFGGPAAFGHAWRSAARAGLE